MATSIETSKKAAKSESPKEFIHCIRKKNGRRRGYMLARTNGAVLSIGFSLCDGKDRFTGSKGLEIARIRANRYKDRGEYIIASSSTKISKTNGSGDIVVIPPTIVPGLADFIFLCTQKKYFGDYRLPSWAERLLRDNITIGDVFDYAVDICLVEEFFKPRG